METTDALTRFHPLIERWFRERIGEPTDVQAQAWPRIARGEHVLVAAPTGSGKTLTAFLWALNQLITGAWETGATRVVYISPLKALNNDIQRNLLRPLSELRDFFAASAEPFPEIRVLTRSGDTPQADRRRMQRKPPEILITTPESLNLLLSSRGGRSLLRNIETVILDEIHAVVDSKRGTHLITAVDRLVPLCGEFQRIALSATVRPMEVVAEFVGGYEWNGDAENPEYTPRSVTLIRSAAQKRYDIRVRFPEEAEDTSDEALWARLVAEFKEIIRRNRSTLLFTNSRALCEKLTLFINADEERPIAYAHHGSLSREIRTEVERQLKEGLLKAIVSTSSLEMGIDIGALDEVVLVQSPGSVSSAIQRLGRAGHQVGEVSRGTLFPTHARDFRDAAVLAAAILEGDIEELRPIRNPLDVLAQVLVSMTAMETWHVDELYAQIRTSYPYRHLGREPFDAVLNMLAGRYEETRIRELKPRLSIDRIDGTVEARPGAVRAVYTSGGTIPDRGYYHLRHLDTDARIGDLDEEFVWEASPGQVFTLGTQHWRIEKITHNDVYVRPAGTRSGGEPFWKAEAQSRDFHFSERIGRFLEHANERLDDPGFPGELERRHCMDGPSSRALIDFLNLQKTVTRCDLPHRHHLLVERIRSGPDRSPTHQIVLHTLWGGDVNRPFGMALDAAWEERYGHRPEVYVDNDCVVLMTEHLPEGDEVLSLVESGMVEALLRKRLEGSGFFGARFRECAGRALLLARTNPKARMPLWLSRVKSQNLLDAIMNYEDFPILLEAWRACLQDEFDLDALHLVLQELENGMIRWTDVLTPVASPFAQSISWRQINQYMYMDDTPKSGKRSKLRGDLLREVTLAPDLRPRVPKAVVEAFERKRQRLAEGYAPGTAREFVEWVKERVAIPLSEWEALREAIERDHEIDLEAIIADAGNRLASASPPEAVEPLIVAREMLPRILFALFDKGSWPTVDGMPWEPIPDDATSSAGETGRDEVFAELLGQWLSFYGPRDVPYIARTLGVEKGRLAQTIADLIDGETLIEGALVADGGTADVCDRENFEILLRMARREAKSSLEPLAAEWLPAFLATVQGLTGPEEGIDGLARRLEQLLCHPARVEAWEAHILPVRVRGYVTSWLDTLMQTGELLWIGAGNRRIAFCYEGELNLLRDDEEDAEEPSAASKDEADADATDVAEFFLDPSGRYPFSALRAVARYDAGALAERLWAAAWRGEVTNDSFLALREGIEVGFTTPTPNPSTESSAGPRRFRTGRFRRVPHAQRPAHPGNWRLISPPEPSDDLLEVEERKKDRVRVLLDRYGVLFRELLDREAPPFRWSRLFRSLRLMELSGEVVGGVFFHGVPGPQFAAPRVLPLLERLASESSLFWVNAADPASLCGVALDALRGRLPKRVSSNDLVFRGNRLLATIERGGRVLTLHVPPDDPDVGAMFAPLHHRMERAFRPVSRIVIETINGEPAPSSPYVEALRVEFEVAVDYKTVVLYRKLF